MINLFIDTNIGLNLYDYSKERLNSFNELYDILNSEIILYRNTQLKDEIFRNRDEKINKALSVLTFSKINFPSFCHEYEDYEEIKEQHDLLNDRFENGKNKIAEDAYNHELEADKLILKFFDEKIDEIENKILDDATIRQKRGNPPGKKNDSLGDAINGEYLLETVKTGEDLYLITEDSDFQSPLNKDELNYYLLKEGKEKKKSNIYLYKSLNKFVKEKDVSIKSEVAKTEIEKESLIEDLTNSVSFAETHALIAQLNGYKDGNYQQIQSLCIAAVENMQVGGIIMDEDVCFFYKNILSVFNLSKDEDFYISKVYKGVYGE